LEALEVRTNILYSKPQALRLPLRWIAILYGRLNAQLAAISGVHSAIDVLKLLMAGADVTMICSVLYERGIDYLQTIEHGLCEWMAQHEYESVAQMRGSLSQQHCPDPVAFERALYLRALQSYHVV
jgi:dihydroorotate dehydrogenase (fumarate)